MRQRRLSSNTKAALVAVGLVAMLAPGCRGQLSDKPPIHLNPNMDNVTRYDPQEPNAFFPDDRAMRPFEPHTVAYGELRADTHYYEGLVDGELATTLPPQIELSEALVERGRQRFDIFCAACHGHAAYGDSVVVERGMLRPPSFHDERLRHEPLGHFFTVMSNGIRNMPSYRSQIPVADRWAIVTYIRALQLSQVAQLGASEDDSE